MVSEPMTGSMYLNLARDGPLGNVAEFLCVERGYRAYTNKTDHDKANQKETNR